jgi:predicted DCC family thiol-disulfide oxidoreductase YuxK
MNSPALPLTIYYDGSCRMCTSEIENLAARSAPGDLVMIDCSPADFDTSHLPADHETMMNLIHAVDAKGQWFKGVDVFIAAYETAQMGWVANILAHPLMRPQADRAYPWVVRNRYRIAKLGLHRVLNLFTHRALLRRAHEAAAHSAGCKNDACVLNTKE